MGLLASGSGAAAAGTACDHLRTVVKALGGWSAPTQVVGTPAELRMTDDGCDASAGLLERVQGLCDELVVHTSTMAGAGRSAAVHPLPRG